MTGEVRLRNTGDVSLRNAAGAPSERTWDYRQFQSFIGDFFVPLKITSENRAQFSSRVRVLDIDQVHLLDVTASPHLVDSAASAPGTPASHHYYNINFQLSGHCALRQDGREGVLRPGDSVLCDTSRPYTLSFSETSRAIVMTIPRSAIDLPPSLVAQLTATTFSPTTKIAGLVNPFVLQLASGINLFDHGTAKRLVNHAVGLYSTLLFSEVGVAGLSSHLDGPQALLRRIYLYIDDRLSDNDLGPERIAADHFISTRYLYSLFQGEDMSVSAWIRSRRLEKAKRDLSDPTLFGQSISTIARRWALTDPAHFSHVFKLTFGLSPSELRHRAMESSAGRAR